MSDYGQRSEDRNQGYGRGDRAGRGGGPRRYDGAGREGRGDRGYRNDREGRDDQSYHDRDYHAFCIQTRLLSACRLLEEMNLPHAAEALLADKMAMKALALQPSDIFDPAERP